MSQSENEQCWILWGRNNRWWWSARLDRRSVGEPASVTFDHEYVWEHRKHVVGFWHSHPSWTCHPSSTDHVTMKSWVAALGKPLLCAIDGIDGMGFWWYLDDESRPIRASAVQVFGRFFGRVPNAR